MFLNLEINFELLSAVVVVDISEDRTGTRYRSVLATVVVRKGGVRGRDSVGCNLKLHS
jgi:hypothetical protein